MVRLLRVLIRLLFRAAAVAALVWIGRELMRRWVDGPEQPQVAGDWEARRPQPAPAVTTAPSGDGDSAVTPGPEPAKKARAKKAAAPVKPAARVKPATPAEAPGAVEVGGGVDPVSQPAATPAAGPSPSKRRQRPLKATRIPKAAPAAKAAPGTEPDPASGSAWVSPNGSGDAPSTHPVKAKLVSRLYRVPGMPMYNRTVPDRCYTTPEAAEADGFTRAAR
ncbi:MAG TPA: hypothetical protein VFJ79_00210 [Acidimicrobiales bacterium]|nr:hypothetical protein [Acidimicrobiales bacterium]